MLALVPFRDLTKRPFAEVCRAKLIVRAGGLTAFACELPYLGWEGRSVSEGRRLVHRVALYDAHHQLVGVFDDAPHRVNDIAFHPIDPVLAIATGDYDGGYFFDGGLFVWNYRTGGRRTLLKDREVPQCRFEPDGQLTILVQPPTDRDRLSPYYGRTFDPRVECDVADLVPCVAADFGFDDDRERALETTADARAELGIDPRAVIWDLAWTFDGRIAAAVADGRLELWSTNGQRDHVIWIDGTVVQLLRQPTQLIVHVTGERSKLLVLEGNGTELWLELPGKYACSVDASGRILARHVEPTGRRRDLLISTTKQFLVDADLGSYEGFNHFLRIDGASELFLLRGTPMSSHERKRLCVIAPEGIVVFPELAWDLDGEHRTDCSAILLDDDLVCSYSIRRGNAEEIAIERRLRPVGEVVWSHRIGAAAIALIAWPAVGGVVAALVDGSLCVLDADGNVLLDEPFLIDGVPTIPTALLVHEETLIIGTIDGRISMLSLR